MPKREDETINNGYLKVEKGSGKRTKIVLRLYVAGMTRRSIKAINNLKKYVMNFSRVAVSLR